MLSNKKFEVIIYTKNNCPYCDATRTLLNLKEIDFEEIDIKNSRKNTFEDKVLFDDEHLPKIFVDDELIGGYQQLVDLIAKGKI